MQAAAGFSAVLPVKGKPAVRSTAVARVPAARRSIRAAAVAVEPAEGVFPMEACELLGGEACSVQMFPEVKLASAAAAEASKREEDVESEYLAYDEPKTVFPGEACDDLGGEFCEAPYQAGVSRELVLA